jgi:hypothetical protein
MWRQLFPKAFVICLDRDVSESGNGYTVLKVDQSNAKALEEAIEAIPQPARLIIDDGSHHPQHQLSTFSLLFKNLLQPKGIYIIEDIETSYWLCGNLYGRLEKLPIAPLQAAGKSAPARLLTLCDP